MDRCQLLEIGEDDDDEDYDDEDSVESESIVSEHPQEEHLRWERVGPGRWFVTTASEVAFEGVRNLFGPLNDLDDPRDEAAKKIQAVVRGHLVRQVYESAVSLVRMIH